MTFVIGLLTLILVLDCIVLVFLVLIQLPKKDAGAGLAFGGAASDALFGAGSGNVLTKVTKYAAGVFFALAILLSMLQNQLRTRTGSGFAEKLSQTDAPAGAVLPPATAPASNYSTLVPTNLPAPAVTPESPAPAPATPPASNPAPAAPQ